MEVVVTTGAVNRAKLQSNCHHQHPTFYRLDALPVKALKGKTDDATLVSVHVGAVGHDAEKVQEQDQALQHGAEFVLSEQQRWRQRRCCIQRAAVVNNGDSYAVPA